MFITIDGPDGTGKSTLAQALCRSLTAANRASVITAEPTTSETGKKIRAMLQKERVDVQLMTDLFIQDREEHLQEFIIPQIAKGNIVVCDRYRYSTVVYQHLQGQPLETLICRNGGFLQPHLSVILYAKNLSVLLDRIQSRGQPMELFEKEETLRRASELYLSMKQYYPKENFLFLDALESVEWQVSQILHHIPMAQMPKTF